MTSMKQHEVAGFVADLHAAGLTIIAIGQSLYVIYDDKLPMARCFDIGARLDKITKKYGNRSHLSSSIVSYLRSIGRRYEPSEDSLV